MSKARAPAHEVAIQVKLWGWSCQDGGSRPLPARQHLELRAFLRLLGALTGLAGEGPSWKRTGEAGSHRPFPPQVALVWQVGSVESGALELHAMLVWWEVGGSPT